MKVHPAWHCVGTARGMSGQMGRQQVEAASPCTPPGAACGLYPRQLCPRTHTRRELVLVLSSLGRGAWCGSALAPLTVLHVPPRI